MVQIGIQDGPRLGITDDGGMVVIGGDGRVGFSLSPVGVIRLGQHRADDLTFIMPRLAAPRPANAEDSLLQHGQSNPVQSELCVA